MHLTRIGYWRSDSDVTLPDPSDWIDPSWDTDEQAVVTGYLIYCTVARSYMGYAACRICGHPNGNIEFSDGTYIWPERLGHYLEWHSVRLPTELVEHVIARMESLEGSEVSDTDPAALRVRADVGLAET